LNLSFDHAGNFWIFRKYLLLRDGKNVAHHRIVLQ
jgi:hypothetical protein